jgi:hypothetical protein
MIFPLDTDACVYAVWLPHRRAFAVGQFPRNRNCPSGMHGYMFLHEVTKYIKYKQFTAG